MKVESQEPRCGFIALIGAPNAGKSTLINGLVGAKVSIVSRKVQTTRMVVRGIVIEGQSEMILVDTPGLFTPKRRLDRAMVASAWSGAKDADVLALIVDARRGIEDEVEAILTALVEIKNTKILVLNKIDLLERPKLLTLAQACTQRGDFQEIFMISALNGDGIADFKTQLAARMPKGPWLYPIDQLSDTPLRLLAGEITREKIFERLHDELPYQIHVETDSWKNLPDGSVRIEQTIYVTRDGHKKIVIGEAGKTIKTISMAARKEIAEAADCPVHLFLFVKVRENWQDNSEHYRHLGLEFPND